MHIGNTELNSGGFPPLQGLGFSERLQVAAGEIQCIIWAEFVSRVPKQ